MSKSVLIISASPRKGGNSDTLCDQFAKGAKEAGNEVEKLRLSELHIEYCSACYACKKVGHCVKQDDMEYILDKMRAADVIVLVTPVYFYTMNAQLKTLIDAAFTGCDYSALVADGVIDIFLLSPGCWNVRAFVILYQCQFPVPSANLRVYGVACGV